MGEKQAIESDEPKGLNERHWQLLTLIAQQGELDTTQVTTLMFSSRPSAARHLNVLLKAGLLRRYVGHKGSSHLARYRLSLEGKQALERRLRGSGQPVPIGLGERGHADRNQRKINDFFVRLVHHARITEGAYLYRWRHALDTAVWLRTIGVSHAHPDGYGLWVEGDSTISFLLHLDRNKPSALDVPRPSQLLDGYRQAPSGVPVDAVLVLTPTARREKEIHRDLVDAPIPLAVAATTHERLAQAHSPADAIWTATAAPTSCVRLSDITRSGHAG